MVDSGHAASPHRADAAPPRDARSLPDLSVNARRITHEHRKQLITRRRQAGSRRLPMARRHIGSWSRPDPGATPANAESVSEDWSTRGAAPWTGAAAGVGGRRDNSER